MRRLQRALIATGVAALVAIPMVADAAAPVLPATPSSLTFSQAIALAVGATPAVELATLRQKEASTRVWQSRSALLPSFGGAASYLNRTYNLEAMGISIPHLPGMPALGNLVGPLDNVDARVKLTQTLFDYASWVRVSSARDGLSASRADRGAAIEGAAQAAALAYLRAARAQAMVAARQADTDLAAELLALAQSQVTAGVAPGIDATRARTQLAAARGQLLVAQNQLGRARIDLARALGLDPAAGFDLADTLATTLATSTAPLEGAAATTLALERRPELQSETARLARARADRLAISAERLPRLDFAADYGVNGLNIHDAIPTRDVSVAVTLPLLDGLRREARIAEQSSVLRESQVRQRDLRQQISAEVAGALLDIGSGQEQQKVADERLSLAVEELAQARDRFVNGVAGNIEVINAQSSLIHARDAVIDARFTSAVARVALARAVGVAQTLR